MPASSRSMSKCAVVAKLASLHSRLRSTAVDLWEKNINNKRREGKIMRGGGGGGGGRGSGCSHITAISWGYQKMALVIWNCNL